MKGTILATSTSSVEATSSYPDPCSWQTAMKRSVRSGKALCKRLELPELSHEPAESDFSVFAPLEYVARMEAGNPSDPLLRQVLSTTAESESTRGFLDPVGDLPSQRSNGLLQKYSHRALMITTGACAINCRYCFRRHFPYSDVPTGKAGWAVSLGEIAEDSSIEEVILSGGDPLTLADESLTWLVTKLNEIPHIRRIRIHTRVPVVIPQRVCPSLLSWAQDSSVPIYWVLHINHLNEIDRFVCDAVDRLRQTNTTILNQAVLLRGVNDSSSSQLELCKKLVDIQVLPYYLHQLDPVRGAMHFEVDNALARMIVECLRENLPGYAVPRLVREVSGEKSKSPV